MTDATLSVTQSRVEAMVREYVRALDGKISEEEDRWRVTLPPNVDVPFVDDSTFVLVLDTTEAASPNEYGLTPESSFTQQLLEHAANADGVGSVTLTSELVPEVEPSPSWAEANDVSVVDVDFTPYYDRTAACVFVEIGVETVSEYQTQFLRATTVDLSTNEPLPTMSDVLLETFFRPDAGAVQEREMGGQSPDVDSSALRQAVSTAQDVATDQVRPSVEEIREQASRAAGKEFTDYRQLQEQRLSDFRAEIDQLTDRLRALTTKIDTADSQDERIEALQKRKELQAEKESKAEKRDEILDRKERGYTRKRAQIYDRHAIDVSTKPVAVTLVSYERGEADLTLSDGVQRGSIRAPFAGGAGITDVVRCPECAESLSRENPVVLRSGLVTCRTCTRHGSQNE